MLFLIVISALRDWKSPQKTGLWKQLALANWIFYFCAFASGFLCFGVVAELQEIQIGASDMRESMPIIVFFSVIILCSGYIAVFQKIWRIRYHDDELIFRNFIGRTYRYPLKDVKIVTKKRMKQLYSGNKKITQWDELLVNMQEEILFERAIERN